MCHTINHHWGHCPNDYNFKSVPEIIQNLCQCRKSGANYLLNIAPTPQGGIPALESSCLERVGRWISTYSSLIYDGRPTEVKCPGHDFVLSMGGKLYYFAFNLRITGDSHVVLAGQGQGLRTISGIERPIEQIRWIDNGEKLSFSYDTTSALGAFDATEFSYGCDWVVRIAEISLR